MTHPVALAHQLRRLADGHEALADALVRHAQPDDTGIRTSRGQHAPLPFDERASCLRADVRDFAIFATRCVMDEVEVTRIEHRSGPDGPSAVQVTELWSPPKDQSIPNLLRTLAREQAGYLAAQPWIGDTVDDLSHRLDIVLGPRPSRALVLARHAQLVGALRAG